MGRGLDGYLISVHWHCVVLKAREGRSLPVSGGYGEGETPLPFPNRAVKPLRADGTWPERAWESRSPPVYIRHARTSTRDDVKPFFRENPQVLVLLVICVVLGLGTFLAVIFGLMTSGSTTTDGEPSGVIMLAQLLL